jgi:hypothetical protein
MISMRVPMLTDLCLYMIGSLLICVRLRASSLDCMTAGVLSIFQFGSPNSANSEEIHIRCPGHSCGGSITSCNSERLLERTVWA